MKICFVHIPKTGGTSLKRYMDQFFTTPDICPWDQTIDLNFRDRAELVKYDLIRGHIYGNIATEKLGPEYRYVTMLRDPVKRIISDYYFHRNEPDRVLRDKNQHEGRKAYIKYTKTHTLEEFVTSTEEIVTRGNHNALIKWLFGDEAIRQYSGTDLTLYCFQKLFEDYHCVGILEDMDNFVHQFETLLQTKGRYGMGRENVGKKKKQEDLSHITELVRERNNEEIRLYEMVREHLANFKIWKHNC